jgi:amphi-Trp domain-containing protein
LLVFVSDLSRISRSHRSERVDMAKKKKEKSKKETSDKPRKQAQKRGSEKKSKKTSKQKVVFDNLVSTDEAIAYLDSIIGGLKKGKVVFKQSGERLILSVPDSLQIGVKARSKSGEQSLSVNLSWRDV